MELDYLYDPTKRGLVYAKPGNRDVGRTPEEVAKDGGQSLEEGLSVKKPLCNEDRLV